jgi:hypothetical protein
MNVLHKNDRIALDSILYSITRLQAIAFVHVSALKGNFVRQWHGSQVGWSPLMAV